MRTIEANQRAIDQREYERRRIAAEAEKKVPLVDTMPISAYEHQFVQPLSMAGNTSDSGSQDSLVAAYDNKMDLGLEYDPSNWYYEPGTNPISYQMGQKVMNPFTEPLRRLQSAGDKQKLKQVVTRQS